jgi:type II secretory pathway pseudopilin PulG
MNKQQKRILVNFAVVTAVTIAAVLGMVELKNWVNRSEAMRAMEQLERAVSDYKQKNGSVPPQSYVDGLKESLEGQVRLGNLRYRARWIKFGSPPDEILAYVIKDYHSLFFRPGAIVLRFDGRVQWMGKREFEKLLAAQQSQMEIEMTPK